MRPCHDLVVELASPDPTKNWFIVEVDSMDGAKTLAPDPLPDVSPPSTLRPFTIDVSALDSQDLLEEGGSTLPPGFVWVDFTSQTMSIGIDRGIDTIQGIAARVVAGTLTASIVDPNMDALANRAIGIHTPIRVRAGVRAVFTGAVTELATEYDAQGVATVTVAAADAIAHLNSTETPARPAESFHDRVNAVAQTSSVPSVIAAPGSSLTATDKPTTALELLHSATDSEAGLSFVNLNNELRAWTKGMEAVTALTPPTYLFSDDHRIRDHICMTAVKTGIDTKEVINTLQVSNLEFDTTDPDPTRHAWKTVQHEFASSSSTKYYGVAPGRVNTTLPPAVLPAYAADVFARFDTAQRKVTNLEYLVDDFTTTQIPESCFVDIGDVAQVHLQTNAWGNPVISVKQRVARISHRILPGEWLAQITFMGSAVEAPVPLPRVYQNSGLYEEARTYE